MSFWSSANFVRAAKPPVITVSEFAPFIRDMMATGIVENENAVSCQFKYGPTIDMDERSTNEIEWDESGMIGTTIEYPWDVSVSKSSLFDLCHVLAGNRNPIYRVSIQFGELNPRIVESFTRESSEDNETPLCLSDLSFEVDPQIVMGLGSEAPAFVGWMGLTFSGPGYFYPWEYRDVRLRAESNERIQMAMAVCQKTWPVTSIPASDDVIAGRKQMLDLWLYDVNDMPSNWLWFVKESG